MRFFVAGAVRRGQRLFARSFPPFVIPATFRHSREGGNPETPAAVIPAQMICCPSTQNKKQSCNILIYIVIFIYVYLRYANARLHKYIRVTV
ncbi:hypothetical protein COI09_05025 [Neisseria meningitidis]|uniref:Uncharacterized protein n=1 Tax=Neisseria meningitidis TaxID=487 RepID=A0A425AQC6_NEIME|nr:hypothetical protein COI24_03900 [Neisseria meningitidis]RQJ58827.1 hypothetical protein COI16_05130 [Neisseria meningitidis]RQJ67531.1 hypothetical protein COI09_05025 [Neisseria meningitidis]